MSSQLPRLGMTGITGIGQMTPAAQQVLAKAGGAMRGTRGNGKRRRNGSKKKAAGAKRAKKRAGGKAAKFVKGSKAAKAWMAKIRKMRK